MERSLPRATARDRHSGSPEAPLRRPEVIAHRGLPREYPENTLDGFEAALAAGVDGIELDVHATCDDVVVVHHDPRVTVPGRDHPLSIAGVTWDELRDAVPLDRAIPRLVDVVDLVRGRAVLYVELKGRGIERSVVEIVRPEREWCAVHAFDHRAIATVRRYAPELRTGVLMSSYLLHPLSPLHDTGAADLWQQVEMVDAPLVAAAHAHGARVIVWTVNDDTVVRDLAAWGVDGICTDVPERVMPLVRR